MHFIIIDIEATCWENEFQSKGKIQEIIEIGAVKVNEGGDIIGRFNEFVRPVAHLLSEFCQRLTSISQAQVNKAETYPIIMEQFKKWIGVSEADEKYLFCSWGFFDQRILSRNCLQHNLDDTWAKPHISLKHQYPRLKGIPRTWGLRKTVESEGFEFEGTAHRAIDDAINLSKIFVAYQTRWEY